jgi:hypothetical protein
MNPLTLTPEQLVELRDAMYTADAALRAVLDDTSGNDPASIKRARNLLAVSLTTLRAVKRRAEQAADEGAPAVERKQPAHVEPRLVCGHVRPVKGCDACAAWAKADERTSAGDTPEKTA